MKLTEKASLFEKMAKEALRVKSAQVAAPAVAAAPKLTDAQVAALKAQLAQIEAQINASLHGASPVAGKTASTKLGQVAPKLTDAQVAALKAQLAQIEAQINASLHGASPVAGKTASIKSAQAALTPAQVESLKQQAAKIKAQIDASYKSGGSTPVAPAAPAPTAAMSAAEVASLKQQAEAIRAQINASLNAPSVAPVSASAKAVRFEKSAQAFQQINELSSTIPTLWTHFTNAMRTPALWPQIPVSVRPALNDQWATMLKNLDVDVAAKLNGQLRAFFAAVPVDVKAAAFKAGGDKLAAALDQFAMNAKTIQQSVPADKAPAATAPEAGVAAQSPSAAPAHKGPAQFLQNYMKTQKEPAQFLQDYMGEQTDETK
jgi:hypothetical protein